MKGFFLKDSPQSMPALIGALIFVLTTIYLCSEFFGNDINHSTVTWLMGLALSAVTGDKFIDTRR